MPVEAEEEKAAIYIGIAQSTPMCPYKCSEGYPEFDDYGNHKCLSSVYLFFDNMGGIQVFIIIVIATVFAISAIIYFLMANKKDDDLENDTNLNKLKL